MQEGYPLLGNHTQQPFEVVARRAQHGMQLVAFFTLKVAAIHPVIRFQMTDNRFNGLSAFQLLSFQRRQPFGFASVFGFKTQLAQRGLPYRAILNNLHFDRSEGLVQIFPKSANA